MSAVIERMQSHLMNFMHPHHLAFVIGFEEMLHEIVLSLTEHKLQWPDMNSVD